MDVGLSVKENVIKEAKEEAGLDVTADMIIAVQDREKHNLPAYTYKICKIFVLCTSIGAVSYTHLHWHCAYRDFRNLCGKYCRDHAGASPGIYKNGYLYPNLFRWNSGDYCIQCDQRHPKRRRKR